MEVIFSNRAYASVLSETTEKIQTETGGLFLGTVIDDVWYIIESIDPGPNSVFEVAYFEYDQAYTQHLIRKIANLYSSKLDLIGLWHRHPGSFDIFSQTDDGTNSKYASMREKGAISALVNIDPNFRITMYHVDQPCRYTKIKYNVGDEYIPQKLLQLKSKSQFEKMMQNILSPHEDKGNVYHRSASFGSFMRSISPYLDEVVCEKIFPEPEMDPSEVSEKMLDVMIEDISFFSDEVNMEISLAQRDKYIVMVQEAIDETTRVYFTYCQEEDVVVFEYKGKSYYYNSGYFKNTFARYVADQRERERVERTELPGKPTYETRQSNFSNLIRILFGGEKQ